jgi:type I restriction enzyme S subunit
MNEGWRMTKLGEICKISTGNANTEDAIENGLYAFFDRSKIIKKSSSYIFDCDAIIIPGEGQTFMPKLFSGKFNLHQRAYAIFNFEECVSIEYVYKYLIYFHKYFEEVAVGATVKSLRLRHFQELPIPIPPLPEQQRIVSLLDEAFAAIDKAKANAEKNLKNAKELFESYLQGVFENKGDSWGERKLQDITEFDSPITYGVVKPGIEGEVKFVRGGDLQKGRILVNQLRTISLDISNQYKRTLLKGGELLICLVGMPGQTAVAPIELKGANIARQVGLIRLEKEYSAEFYNYYFQSKQGIEKLGLEESGAVQRVINLAALRNISVPVISPSEQHRIVQNLEAFSSETKRLESIYRQKLSDLEELKKSILQKAFNGELNTADICV